VSAVQLRHPHFVADVRHALDSTGLCGSLLTLELTESVLVEHQDVEVLLNELRSFGIGIAIDDFGTGYSSLSYLRRFPVTSVKIDRSFINELTTSHDSGLVKSIIHIAEALGLSTIAEGVETNDQLDLLAAIDCRLAQGFYLGRPQPREHIDELLMRTPGQLRETVTS
jgi:EAL domain-containing protein (putative c-di-GMP-specific phosphodiesterase class I)